MFKLVPRKLGRPLTRTNGWLCFKPGHKRNHAASMKDRQGGSAAPRAMLKDATSSPKLHQATNCSIHLTNYPEIARNDIRNPSHVTRERGLLVGRHCQWNNKQIC